MKKQNIVIIGVIVFALAVAVGYALFKQTLTINGTATARGNFDVEFTSIGEITKSGYTDATSQNGANIATIEEGKKALTITVNKLDYPGAYVEIPVTITNKGSIPAKLKSIEQTGLDTDAGPIKVTYSGIASGETPINQNETQSMKIRVEWLEDSEETAESASFTVRLNYEQVSN